MKKMPNKITAIALLMILCGSIQAQKIPVLLTQKLQTAPTTIITGSDYEVHIVYDTANLVAIKTTVDAEEIDSLHFPEGQLTVTDGGKRIVIIDELPYHKGIEIHTTTNSLTLHASKYSKINLGEYTNDTIKIDHLLLRATDDAFIEVEQTVKATLVNMKVDKYGSIRHRNIISPNVNRMITGKGRINELNDNVNEAESKVEESTYAILFDRDHREIPVFMDWNFGICGIGASPFGGFNVPTGNFVWSTGMIFNYTGRYAFWQKDHWSISTGIAVVAQTFRTDNAYIDFVTDNTSGETSLTAVDASALFAAEEATNGHILWSSRMTAAYIGIPIRVEWRRQPDYKGWRAAAELRPSFAMSRKSSYLIHNGFYEGKNEVASTRNEKAGKYINPFRLDMRLSITYNMIELFAETSLTPIFRANTDKPESKPAINQKLYSVSAGFCLTF